MNESAAAEPTYETVELPPPGEMAESRFDEDSSTRRATCPDPDCTVGVLYQPLVSGNGVKVLEHWGDGPDDVYTMGANGRPTCPRGHGELELADDTLPAEEAITEADARLRQASLPGIVPEFNYQGAYLELETMAVDVDRLKREYDNDAAIAKDAKKRWDRAAETYTKAALELRRRRREKVETGDAISDLAPEGEQPELTLEPDPQPETIAAATPAEPEVEHRYPKRGKKQTRKAPAAIRPQPKKKAAKKKGGK